MARILRLLARKRTLVEVHFRVPRTQLDSIWNLLGHGRRCHGRRVGYSGIDLLSRRRLYRKHSGGLLTLWHPAQQQAKGLPLAGRHYARELGFVGACISVEPFQEALKKYFRYYLAHVLASLT
jgi:hypothetical protein